MENELATVGIALQLVDNIKIFGRIIDSPLPFSMREEVIVLDAKIISPVYGDPVYVKKLFVLTKNVLFYVINETVEQAQENHTLFRS